MKKVAVCPQSKLKNVLHKIGKDLCMTLAKRLGCNDTYGMIP